MISTQLIKTQLEAGEFELLQDLARTKLPQKVISLAISNVHSRILEINPAKPDAEMVQQMRSLMHERAALLELTRVFDQLIPDQNLTKEKNDADYSDTV